LQNTPTPKQPTPPSDNFDLETPLGVLNVTGVEMVKSLIAIGWGTELAVQFTAQVIRDSGRKIALMKLAAKGTKH